MLQLSTSYALFTNRLNKTEDLYLKALIIILKNHVFRTKKQPEKLDTNAANLN